MNRQTAILNLVGAIVLAASLTLPAGASEMVYVPVNPSFGGNPNNGVILLNSAQATNKHKDSASSAAAAAALTPKTPLQLFNDTLERSILNQLASATASKISADGKLIPGTVETANFIINIVDLGGGTLQVTTTDRVTGTSTSFQVGQ